jgi:hypothetical protein
LLKIPNINSLLFHTDNINYKDSLGLNPKNWNNRNGFKVCIYYLPL